MTELPRDPVGAFVEAPSVLVAATGHGPLDGCRVAVKDVIDVAGTVTGAGNPQYAADHAPAEHSAAAVEALTAAGATVVGKTVTDELAYSLAGRNVHDGSPINVAAPGRVTGGSSAGAAAAVAAGLVEIGLGTDTGGSIRVPASYCGLFGWRPTHGAVDDRGIVHLARSFDTVALLTRDGGLLAAAADVLLGDRSLAARRVDTIHAVFAAELLDLVDAGVRAALVARIAAPVVPIGLDPLAAAAAFVTLQGREAWCEHGTWLESRRPVLGSDIAARFEAASAVTDEAVAEAVPTRDAVRTALTDATEHGGAVLLAPATLGGAPAVDEPDGSQTETRRRLLALTTPASLAGSPVVVVPGASDPAGLPVGIACIGSPGHDRELLQLATTVLAPVTPLDAVIAALAGVAAGAVNALAGGGTLISFPVLVALGVPPVSANVTNTVALSPGYLGGAWSQRAQLEGQEHRVRGLLGVAAVGGLVGSAVLLTTSDEVFGALVPILLVVASTLLAMQDTVRRLLLRREQKTRSGASSQVGARTSERFLPIPVFAASVYGGFFGAGLGIVLLAVLGVLVDDPLPRVNALKQVLAFIVNVTAAVFFLFSGRVDWPLAVALAVGAVVGGHLGGRVAGSVRPNQLRQIVVVIGLTAAAVYAVQQWG